MGSEMCIRDRSDEDAGVLAADVFADGPAALLVRAEHLREGAR